MSTSDTSSSAKTDTGSSAPPGSIISLLHCSRQGISKKTQRAFSATKSWTLVDGKPTVLGFDAGKWFHIEQRLVTNIFSLESLLKAASKRPDILVIRGLPAPTTDVTKLVRRKSSPDENGKIWFEEAAGQPWALIDIDNLPVPETIDPAKDPDGALDYVVEHCLPPELRDVSFVWQWASSAGMRPGLLSVHLWFWSAQPLTGAELKMWHRASEWLRTHDSHIDKSLFQCVQPHYVAAPIFADGLRDPLSQRVGLRRGSKHFASLVVPVAPIGTDTKARGTGKKPHGARDTNSQEDPAGGLFVDPVEAARGFDAKLAFLGDGPGLSGFHAPLTSAIASYVSEHGTKFDREALKARLRKAIAEAPKNKGREGDILRYAGDKYLDESIEGAVNQFGEDADEREEARTNMDGFEEPVVGAEQGEAGDQQDQAKAQPSRAPLYLDSKNPLRSATRFMEDRYSNVDGIRLRCYQGTFYAWNGTHYVEADDARLRSELYPFLERALDGKAMFRPTITKVNEVLGALKAQAHLLSTTPVPSWAAGGALGDAYLDLLDRPWNPRDIVPCKNGLLHLPTRTLSPHTAQFFALNALDFAFDPQAPEPAEWHKFLGSLWPDDKQAIDTLQEIFGYLLSGDLRQQKIFLLVGQKRSGKGTIGRVLTALLGPSNTAGPTLAGLGQNFGLQSLIGKRAAIIADARLDARADLQTIVERLLSISGEDRLTIDRKYLTAWTGQLEARFMILTNKLPHFIDASGALAGRFVLLQLLESFYGREDLGLLDRLLPELPGILNWSLEGWSRLNERGHFSMPKSSAETLRQLEDLASPIGAFLRDECVVGPDHSVTKDEAYSRWSQWCSLSNMKCGTKAEFGSDLLAAQPRIRSARPRMNGKQTNVYEGVGLKVQFDETAPCSA